MLAFKKRKKDNEFSRKEFENMILQMMYHAAQANAVADEILDRLETCDIEPDDTLLTLLDEIQDGSLTDLNDALKIWPQLMEQDSEDLREAV